MLLDACADISCETGIELLLTSISPKPQSMQLCIPDFDYKTFFWILSLVDEFYTTYDIQPGDGMYVAPEDRPVVW